MGVCLTTTGMTGPAVVCNWDGWELLFKLALEYGWHPLGAKSCPWLSSYLSAEEKVMEKEYCEKHNKEWRVGYFTNDGQVVDGEDCRAMLLALESARSDIAKGNLRKGTCAERIARSIDGCELLDKMIAVCQEGFFHIN